MKIIGKTEKGYLCEMTEQELLALTGLTGVPRDRYTASPIGVEVKVMAAFRYLRDLDRTSDQLARIRDVMQAFLILTAPLAYQETMTNLGNPPKAELNPPAESEEADSNDEQ